MAHRGLDEGEGLAAAEFQLVTGLHVDEVPVLVIVAAEYGFALGGAIHRSVGDFAEQFGESAGMVGLVMLHHYGVDLVQRKLFLEPRHELAVVGAPHRVEQNGLALSAEKIGVIAGTVGGA